MLGFPIAFTLIAMGLGFGYYAYYDELRMQTIFDNRIFDLFVQNTFSVMSNDVLVAVPLFLFMGYVVERANIVNRAKPARFNGGGGAFHLCDICHRLGHHRRGSDANGYAGISSDAGSRL